MPESNPGRTVHVERTVPADTIEADKALEEIMQALRQGAFPCGDLDEVRLALREALNNAVLHGSNNNPQKQVHVACRCDDREGLLLIVRDEGPGFDPSQVPDPTHPENLDRLSGRGVYLIRELMDDVEFRDNGREIRMRRRPTFLAEQKDPS